MPLSPEIECEVNEQDNSLPYVISFKLKGESVICIADIVMQPRRIYMNNKEYDVLAYSIPEGKGWSKGSYFMPVNIIDKV